MLVVHQESDSLSLLLGLCEVAQVHEDTLREEGEVRVTEPHVEAATRLVIEAGVLMECLGASQTGLGVKDELAGRVLLHTSQHLRHWLAKFICEKSQKLRLVKV